jgi:predicted DNA-binding transcriptional regulator AlpA
MADELPDDWWTTENVATFLGVEKDTVHAYVSRKQMPEPDRRMGRMRLWRPDTIRQWHQDRPRQPKAGESNELNRPEGVCCECSRPLLHAVVKVPGPRK